jgi:hypothetical protein
LPPPCSIGFAGPCSEPFVGDGVLAGAGVSAAGAVASVVEVDAGGFGSPARRLALVVEVFMLSPQASAPSKARSEDGWRIK